MKPHIALLLTFFILQGCNSLQSDEKASQELIDRDLEFSNFSRQHGMEKAFTRFADSAAVLLKPDRMPIKGLKSITFYYSQMNNENLELTWMPLDASVSGSRDLGFTYGVWQLMNRDSLRQGTYVTVWKKDANGNWKYILDSGNEGIGRFE
ncbi:MAG: YybH family protein [Bacteroidota bacterium]